jgi:GMP synthase (glutamine-hydrolysing)
MILVLDLGDGRGSAVARRVRSEQVYSEVLSADTPIEAIRAAAPMGILIAGDGSLGVPSLPEIINLGVPVLAMGSSARLMLKALGGAYAPTALGNCTAQVTFGQSPLFEGLGESERYFECMDALELPEGARAIATAEEGQVAAFSVTTASSACSSTPSRTIRTASRSCAISRAACASASRFGIFPVSSKNPS